MSDDQGSPVEGDGEASLEALTGNVESRELEKEMRSSYLDYAMSVIVGRALPDVRDGLKPVHRRVLYAMHDLGLQPNRPYRKCAFIVGEVMGKYHPHGDSAIYDTLVRMAQDFSLRYPLVDGQGNFGSIDGDTAAAMRYTEARLGPLATQMLRDIDADTVDFGPNYDERTQEPLLLPARFPNLLVNGAAGIAVGMATNIPPHNLPEVAGAVNAFIDDPEIDLKGLMKHIKGPDFPGGGTILGTEGVRDAYASGRGSVKVRAKAHVEPMKNGKESIIITELPFQVRKGGEGGLIVKIADLVREKKITGISDLRDESDRSGMRVVIELKRGGDPAKVVLNQLYKRTQMQQSFGINMVALVDGVPKTLSLLEAIRHYVVHQRDVITRRTQHQLARAEARAHILEGLLIALDNLDAVIKLIRKSADPDVARDALIDKFELSRPQAQAILDMRLQRLTALEAGKIKEEHAELTKLIKNLRAILADEAKILGIVKDELSEIVEKYGDERRTDIAAAEGEVDIEDMIADQQMVISITSTGYAKRLPLATYRQQRRGGRGVMGMNMKEGDYIEHLHVCSTHDFLLFFTNKGKVYRIKVYELPEGARTSKGRALVNLLPLTDGEQVMAVIPTRDFSEGKLPRLRHQEGDGQEDRVQGLRHADPRRRDHRDQHQEGRRARRGPPDLGQGRHHHGLEVGQRRPLQREARSPDGPGHRRRQGHERLAEGQRGALARGRARPGRALRRHRERLRQAEPDVRVPGQGPRHPGRPDDQADPEEGRPRRRDDRPRPPGADLHLPERDGAAERRRRHLDHGPLHAGRPRDEPEAGRPRQRRGPRGRERQRRLRREGRRASAQKSLAEEEKAAEEAAAEEVKVAKKSAGSATPRRPKPKAAKPRRRSRPPRTPVPKKPPRRRRRRSRSLRPSSRRRRSLRRRRSRRGVGCGRRARDRTALEEARPRSDGIQRRYGVLGDRAISRGSCRTRSPDAGP